MEIKVKFKPGQLVYFMRNNGICDGIVNTVFARVDGEGSKVAYIVGKLHNMEEDILFSTKEALLESLL